jgi:hypothetical protein
MISASPARWNIAASPEFIVMSEDAALGFERYWYHDYADTGNHSRV